MSLFDPSRTNRVKSAHVTNDAPCASPSSSDHEPLAEIPRRVAEGLLFLRESQEYAEDVGTDHWNFALELRELRSLGLTNSDLRWLAMKGYVEFGRETTLPGEATRSFHRLQGLTFTKRTCCIITPAGIEASKTLHIKPAETELPHVATPQPTPAKPSPRVVPHWDADMQELRINGLIVKQFKVPAPNQEMVLAAFEEEQWPARIDDPLPPQADQDPKRRLHDTIVSLNRSHKHRLIRFMGDGSGEGVRWTVIGDSGEETSNDEPSADET